LRTAAAGLGLALCAGPALAEDAAPAPPVLTFEALENIDFWRNVEGGVRVGDTTLNKLRLAATFDGTKAGLPGWRAHVQVFRTNGEVLSASRIGDIQTASNIEAPSVTRLMDAWVERDFSHGLIRVGIQDLNLDFDSIDTASLFLNSSHGIAPDLSQTGRNGPSIFPEGGLAVEGIWNPNAQVSLKLGVFDGAPGDPARPNAFIGVRLDGGALVIGEANYKPGDRTLVGVGAWGYTATFDAITPGAPPRRGQQGVYAFAQVMLAHNWSGWVRAGFADADINPLAGYVGGGLVKTGPFGRANDQLGFAIAHAIIGDPIRRRDGLPAAETNFEATYALQVRPWLILQPDVQYVVHPALQAGTRNALAVGLRITVDFKRPETAAFGDD
jgi:porin